MMYPSGDTAPTIGFPVTPENDQDGPHGYGYDKIRVDAVPCAPCYPLFMHGGRCREEKEDYSIDPKKPIPGSASVLA